MKRNIKFRVALLIVWQGFWLAPVGHAADLSSPCLEIGPTSHECDPVNSTNPMPIDALAGSNLLNAILSRTALQYPANATPITASNTGTTSATTATLPASTLVHTYICGFSIRANATAAATNNSTVTGTVTGTLNYSQWTAPLASGIGLTEQIFMPCLPSSAINTGIAVISGAPGSGGVVSVTAWGYQL